MPNNIAITIRKTEVIACMKFILIFFNKRLPIKVPSKAPVRAKNNKRKFYRTLMDWEVYPESIYQMIKLFSSYSSVKEIYVTENGASFPDELDGITVHDNER